MFAEVSEFTVYLLVWLVEMHLHELHIKHYTLDNWDILLNSVKELRAKDDYFGPL